MTKRVVLAGGGTGGHVFPLVAIAQAMRQLAPHVEPVFVGTARGMEKDLVPARGFRLRLLEVEPMRGGGVKQLLRGAVRAARLLPEAMRLIEEEDAVGVLSIGGYAAGPVSLAGHLSGVPLGLVEPNSVIGLTNKLVAPFVDRAYTAFDVTEAEFAPSVVRPFGVPLRFGFSATPYRPRPGRRRVLVLGGSQGAKALNEVLPEALSRLPGPVEVFHQCGARHRDEVEERYGSLGMDAAIVAPFIDDMQERIAWADVVVSRSGASALSEIAAVGRPALFVPYPFSSGDHQRVNAEVLARRGGARLVASREATVERVCAELEALLEDDAELSKMAECSRKFGRPDAAIEIARDFFALSGVDCENPGPP